MLTLVHLRSWMILDHFGWFTNTCMRFKNSTKPLLIVNYLHYGVHFARPRIKWKPSNTFVAKEIPAFNLTYLWMLFNVHCSVLAVHKVAIKVTPFHGIDWNITRVSVNCQYPFHSYHRERKILQKQIVKIPRTARGSLYFSIALRTTMPSLYSILIKIITPNKMLHNYQAQQSRNAQYRNTDNSKIIIKQPRNDSRPPQAAKCRRPTCQRPKIINELHYTTSCRESNAPSTHSTPQWNTAPSRRPPNYPNVPNPCTRDEGSPRPH